MSLLICQNSSKAVVQAADCLNAGGVIAVPTETVYGLATLWGNTSGRERIYQMKQRPADKRLQMLAASMQDAKDAGIISSPLLEQLADKYWPGPLTVVAEAINGDSIGLRIPAHDFLLQVLTLLGRPLAATSANLSGHPAAMNANDAVRELVALPDLIIDGGPILHSGGASTVVSILDGSIKILRAGNLVPEIQS